MKAKVLLGIWLTLTALASMIMPAFTADTLVATDFAEESWAKIIDYFDYARAYALLHGIQTPQGFENWHAYVYVTYVNTRGLRMLYAGLINMSFGGAGTFTVPIQTVMMQYKTENKSRDVVMASNFLMLMAFNETTATLYPNSPDVSDKLWSSVSLGFIFESYSHFSNVTWPALHSKATVIPLTYSDNKLHWSWGLKYANLTSLWWRTWISPANHTYNSWPMALATYNELSFTYDLDISPDTNKATLTENHIIGRIRNLWHFGWLEGYWYSHYNSTGCYNYMRKLSDETVYDFLERNQIKMSIVDFQTVAMYDRKTYSNTATGQNVTDNDRVISDSSVSTFADDGERLFDASFGTKKTYNLFNYTKDPTETDYDTYNATARTCRINGFAGNTALFQNHIYLMKFLPYLVANMHPQLYEKVKDSITNMTRANYFYLIAYPTYSGYKVEHDPTFTVYLATTTSPIDHSLFGAFVIATAAVAIVVIVIGVVFFRRKKPQQSAVPQSPQ